MNREPSTEKKRRFNLTVLIAFLSLIVSAGSFLYTYNTNKVETKEFIESNLETAWTHAKNHRRDEAQNALNSIHRIDKDNVDASALTALIHFEIHKDSDRNDVADTAERDVNRLLEAHPRSIMCHLVKGKILRYKSDLSSAEEHLRAAYKESVNTEGDLTLQADIMIELEQVILLLVQDGGALTTRDQERLDEAEQLLAGVLSINGKNQTNLTIALLDQAAIYNLRQDYARAINHYIYALSVTPNKAPVYRSAATVADAMRDYESSLDLCNKSLEIEPSNHSCLLIKHTALLQLGRKQEADEVAAEIDNPVETRFRKLLERESSDNSGSSNGSPQPN